jgi:hypothetical protein
VERSSSRVPSGPARRCSRCYRSLEDPVLAATRNVEVLLALGAHCGWPR